MTINRDIFRAASIDIETKKVLAGFADFVDALATGGNVPNTAANAVTALAGGAKAGATLIAAGINRVGTAVSAGDSILMPVSAPGIVVVVNDTANPITVYGNGTDTVNDVATATGVQQMAQSVVFYVCTAAGNWSADGIGSGYFGSYSTESYADALAANAGGVAAGATALAAMINRFTTVGGAGYSSVLPAATPGLSITVINAAAANSMAVFPAGTDAVNAGANGAAFALPAGGVVTFYATVAGKWHTIYYNPIMLQQAYNTNTATTGATLTAANVTGGSEEVVLNMTGTLGAGANLQMPTVAAVIAAIPNATIGSTYKLRIWNSSAANFAWTVTTNTTWTLTGTMTIAQNTARDFIVSLQSATTGTLQSLGTVTLGAV